MPPTYTPRVCLKGSLSYLKLAKIALRKRPNGDCMTTANTSLEELNPWEQQALRFDEATTKLNLDEGIVSVLRVPAR